MKERKAAKVKKPFKYSREELRQVYERIVNTAQKLYNEGKNEECVSCISAAARYQYNFNDRYSDKRLSELMMGIADRLSLSYNYQPKDDVICFIDSFPRDQQGLSIQYIDALLALKTKRVVFISEIKQIGRQIKSALEQNDAKIYTTDRKSPLQASKAIFDIIKFEQPSVIFYHLTPNSTATLIGTCKFRQVVRCQINLTDHAFWLGDNTFFDYSFEYRTLGGLISRKYRGFEDNQIVQLPYYPWVSGEPFHGFPVNVAGKIVMFSAGALYKTEDKGGIYFNILKEILTRHPNVLFFYAGEGDKTHFHQFIESNSFQDRVFLIGYRDDINEVIKHSDIYLSTYPLFGGLMSQFAAINGIPMLAYGTSQIEDIVCTRKKGNIVFGGIDDLLAEADKLIQSSNYRRERGEYLKSLIAGQKDFRESLREWMTEPRAVNSDNSLPTEPYDSDAFCLQYVERINIGSLRMNIELSLLRRCPRALSLKMWLNLLLNIPEVVRVEKERHNAIIQ